MPAPRLDQDRAEFADHRHPAGKGGDGATKPLVPISTLRLSHDARQVAIASMELQQPSLDDVCLTLTGCPATQATTEHALAQEAALNTVTQAITERGRLTVAESLADSRVMAVRHCQLAASH